MAGKVAKAQVAKFPMHEYNDASFLDPRTAGLWNMDENEVVDQLRDQSFKKRVEVLEQLLITVRRNGGRLPFRNKQTIFRGLGLALGDSNWDVRLKCIQLINEVIPQFGDGLDACMSEIMGRLIPRIGESKITVRRAVIQTLHVYMKTTMSVQGLLRAIVIHGLENEDTRVRKESIVALPMLFTPEFAKENFFEVTHSLAKKLLDTSVEDNLRDSSLMTLEKIRNLVGEREFNMYLHKLSAPLRRYYYQLTGHDMPDNIASNPPTPKQQVPFTKAKVTSVNGTASIPTHQTATNAQYVESYEFGIIPSRVMSQINDQDNFKLRAKGVEELKVIMGELQDIDIQTHLMPHMISFISFLNNLLDDSNFKITTVTLEILCILVERLGQNVKQFLKPLSNTLAKRMGDNKIVVRQAVMKVATKMMQAYSPKPVLSVICENLQHRNSRVRHETLNIVIAALLTFPSYAFDLPGVCRVVAPLLTDMKRQVRQGALECLAVIAQAMGPGRLQPLVQAVDQVELSSEGEGVMGAVQARLARRQLPRLNSEGLVEYATPVPSSASSRGPSSYQAQGADMEWIISGSGGPRGLSRSDTMELESVSSSSTTPVQGMPEPPNQSRPFMSAGRGRKKLPWEGHEYYSENGQDGPPKPRQTWSSDTESSTPETPKKTVPKRRNVVALAQDEPDQGSYKQIHLNKLKKQQSGPVKPSNSFRGLDLAGQNERAEFDSPPSPQYFDYYSEDSFRSDKEEESPIPTKATLARSATRRSNKKVPPISSTDKYSSSKDDDRDSAYAASLGSTLASESHQEMMSSLMSIRSSASKKKEKIIEKQSSHSSLEPSRSPSPDTTKESGIWSTYSSQKDLDSSRKSKKTTESPFESKPKLARSNSLNKKRNGENGESDHNTVLRVDYNPVSGVTFRENRNSDVAIVGKGYNDDPNSPDSRNSIGNQSNRNRKRIQKGSVLSPLGVASVHSYGPIEIDDDKVPSPEGIGVVGKGMFENVNGVEHAITQGNSSSQDRQDRKPMRQDRKDFNSGVVGVGVNKQGSQDDPSMDNWEDIDNDPNNMGISRHLKDKIAQANKEKQEELEAKRFEREKKKQEHEEKLKKERERQQEKLRRLNTSESLGIESLSIHGGNHTPKTTHSPALSPRKKSRQNVESSHPHPLSASSRTPLESDNPADWKPFKDPDMALRDAQKWIGQEEWEIKCNGLNTVRKLSMFHADVLRRDLHSVIIALLQEVKNLRSQVSRLAIVCLGDLFVSLGKHMDVDLDIVARALLHKNGESNGFIREDVDRALSSMVDGATPQKALVALIAGGATHRNVHVRKTTSYFLVTVVDRMGPGRILSGVKDVTERILPTIADFCMDSSPETRYNGRKIIFMLMNHQDFDKMITKHLPQNTLRSVKDIVEGLRVKGLGEGPSESSSARGWRSGHGSRSSSVIRGSSANRHESSESLHSTPHRRVFRQDENTVEEIKELVNLLSASDWRDRHKGITILLEMCESNKDIVATNVVKIFDKFLPKLQDPNSKVNLYALQVMLQIVPILRESLGPVINMAIGNVAPNLQSKNRDIYNTAMDIVQAFMDHIDGAMLIQPMANQAQSASARSKPDLVEKVAELVTRVYPKKQRQVSLHVLPLLWHLLGATNSSGAVQGGSSGIRTATSRLVNALYEQMGQTLIERASGDPNVTPRHIQLLQELVER